MALTSNVDFGWAGKFFFVLVKNNLSYKKMSDVKIVFDVPRLAQLDANIRQSRVYTFLLAEETMRAPLDKAADDYCLTVCKEALEYKWSLLQIYERMRHWCLWNAVDETNYKTLKTQEKTLTHPPFKYDLAGSFPPVPWVVPRAWTVSNNSVTPLP